ncbi:MAG: pilus assembly protein [Acidimicrobiales bacterium]|jgi:Flp pilus assembly protein TadG|nr:pilus assembly protein [Acidimicrobiales bacterium]
MKLRSVTRRNNEDGASLVEFALLLPVFMMIVLGMFSGGQDYNRQLDVTHAAREGARYGATLDRTLATFPAGGTCSGSTWASALQNTIVDRSSGTLGCNQVCVALVSGGAGSLPAIANVTGATATFVNTPADRGYCYDDANNTDPGNRVQVCVDRDQKSPAPASACVKNGATDSNDKIEALLFSVGVHLHSQATAKYEST